MVFPRRASKCIALVALLSATGVGYAADAQKIRDYTAERAKHQNAVDAMRDPKFLFGLCAGDPDPLCTRNQAVFVRERMNQESIKVHDMDRAIEDEKQKP